MNGLIVISESFVIIAFKIPSPAPVAVSLSVIWVQLNGLIVINQSFVMIASFKPSGSPVVESKSKIWV